VIRQRSTFFFLPMFNSSDFGLFVYIVCLSWSLFSLNVWLVLRARCAPSVVAVESPSPFSVVCLIGYSSLLPLISLLLLLL
jgi:hypothetical protein